ncbi:MULTISPECIES: ABC transporter ATP-binding protein [unclassified Hyphomonas]|jgi:putative ABC transport system ATP-binding protein|uniref:Cell division transporter, ATP-binding protein FtsE (TC 3.A.5.1.1) n=3 Tax=root TaxID=1 RepID=A0A170PU76_9ZZZZ|nr:MULTISPECIES: ABC transporter ATP-binding protein [unclassified Hyphomonas]MAN89967.1 methionine ABC transporter ATP-binding protein [Hyphomonadaceae bacterium]MAA83689.1 methionine ABC transporter ATP-binding protein [Hyphomonas sp.]MBG66435.1 methionine ABC transporter ATP-binding protein [Hyphomonas sp.]MDF1805157.1 ABC transporter ATP-binding protein [Hyphomonas sp.]QSR23715.1 methionine ABC transporter ATP-binding protein [Hyphomonas sp. KY3]|tara:strand:- start:10419 stop:11114 length:696 start_codon:yes stop_codon:yes gene_type:complete
MAEPIVSISNLSFAWTPGNEVLDISDFQLKAGERLFLRGASGSGKSTLLGIIAGVLEAGSGEVIVLGQDLATLEPAARDRLRADHLGVIFQMFNLVPYLSVIGNVTLPLRFSPKRRAAINGNEDDEARRLLSRLGLTDETLLARRVSDLSVGQQQRVAAARALIGGPEIVIADEPTSALDADARDQFIDLLSEEARRTGAALLFVSHDAGLATHFDRAVDLGEINRAGVSA